MATQFPQGTRVDGEGFNIDSFNAYVSENGFQRLSKFLVRMHIPPLMQGDPILSNKVRVIEFYCMATAFPGYTLALHEVLRYSYGASEKKPFAPVFQDISMTFIGDAAGHIHKFFTSWMTCMLNKDKTDSNQISHGVGGKPVDIYEVSYKSDYATTIEIITFADTGRRSQKAILLEAYPVRIDDSPMNWGDKNAIMPVQVTFTFHTWYSEDVSSESNNPEEDDE